MLNRKNVWAARLLLLLAAGLLTACAHRTESPPPKVWQNTWSAQEMALWLHQTFPGKTPTSYGLVPHHGRMAVQAQANRAMSVLRQDIVPTALPPGTLHFSWFVNHLLPEADMSLRDKDDSPVRIVLAFDGDKSRFTAQESALAELTQALTGHDKPYATLMYVWCSQCENADVVITNPRTGRIRKVVVQTGPQGLGRWQDHQRDVLADFQTAFGEPAGPLMGIALMTDSDNTQSQKESWYGPIRYVPKP
jgi:Protein of unknown function (DUF3047)